jgi:hypothetical protein
MQDFEAHQAMKLKLLQQAIDEGLASGISDYSVDELIAGSCTSTVRVKNRDFSKSV